VDMGDAQSTATERVGREQHQRGRIGAPRTGKNQRAACRIRGGGNESSQPFEQIRIRRLVRQPLP